MPKAVKVARERRWLGKKLGVGRICAGISTLNVIDTEIVEQNGDALLVVQREIDTIRLRAVAQRRVE
jgi:hypothetical protein